MCRSRDFFVPFVSQWSVNAFNGGVRRGIVRDRARSLATSDGVLLAPVHDWLSPDQMKAPGVPPLVTPRQGCAFWVHGLHANHEQVQRTIEISAIADGMTTKA
jgi:hypothetical protein